MWYTRTKMLSIRVMANAGLTTLSMPEKATVSWDLDGLFRKWRYLGEMGSNQAIDKGGERNNAKE